MLDKKLDITTFRRPAILLAGMLLTAGLLLHVLRSLSVSLRDSERPEVASETSADSHELELELAETAEAHLDLVPERGPAASVRTADFARDHFDRPADIADPVGPSDAPTGTADGGISERTIVPAEFVVDSQLAEALPTAAEAPRLNDSADTAADEADEPTFNSFGELFEHESRRLAAANGFAPVASAGPRLALADSNQTVGSPPSAVKSPLTSPTSAPPSLIAPAAASPQSPPVGNAKPSTLAPPVSSPPAATADRATPAKPTGGGTAPKADAPKPASTPAEDKPVEQTVDHLRGYVLGGLTHLLDTGFYAGYEVSVLSAMDDRDAAVGLADLTNERRYGQDADGTVGAGQRVWIGMQGPGRGFRVGYWGLDSKTLIEGPYDTDIMPIAIRGNSSLEASAIDLEMTQLFGYHASRMLMSFGARYAQYEQVDTLVGFAEIGNGVRLTSLSNALREMDGIGFTASLEGTHPLHLPFWAGGCGHDHCNACGSGEEPGCYPTTGLFWFWNARGAALWGETKAAVLTEATAMIPGSDNISGFASSRDLAVLTNDNESGLGNLELQLGMEYRRSLQILPTNLVLRGGLEYRRWDLGDDGVVSQSFATLQTEDLTQGGRATAYSQIMDEAIDLFGFAFSVGFYY